MKKLGELYDEITEVRRIIRTVRNSDHDVQFEYDNNVVNYLHIVHYLEKYLDILLDLDVVEPWEKDEEDDE